MTKVKSFLSPTPGRSMKTRSKNNSVFWRSLDHKTLVFLAFSHKHSEFSHNSILGLHFDSANSLHTWEVEAGMRVWEVQVDYITALMLDCASCNTGDSVINFRWYSLSWPWRGNWDTSKGNDRQRGNFRWDASCFSCFIIVWNKHVYRDERGTEKQLQKAGLFSKGCPRFRGRLLRFSRPPAVELFWKK